ncbi:ABC transporter ATP-binding protein [Streptomyces sp. NBC_00237]|uniref:dipeptide ABC transporter ATP-binding protein n=1 Tax=Streptomyces sp. NBC_00237 TaxID=2975687 RepID=UPI002255950D|nr:ABC transporter ATP-binding protein [Streptomyces sp. NBC_00237]MCX5206341.1 ABC transporter ATP-binding protein [Streptomyces sp. NBC_00237]
MSENSGNSGNNGNGTNGTNGANSANFVVEVEGLSVTFPGDTADQDVAAVRDLSFSLPEGGALALVGESGSGKSATAFALLGLHRGTDARVEGSLKVAGVDVGGASDAELRALRGAKAAMVFQDPLSSLDPYYAVGDQIAEVLRVHRRVSRRAARARAVEVLDRVGIADAARRSRARPHEFSGGMRQRALIAMALACEPRLLIADEPTTALDVTVQAQILDLLHGLRREEGMGLLLVTHDVGVAAESVDEVLVMREGRAVERGPVTDVLGAPRRTYTRTLLEAVPRLDGPLDRVPVTVGHGEPVLEAVGLHKEFRQGRRTVTAVDDVSLTVHRGETLGIVGESGSGKTTLGRMLVRLLEPTSGRLRYGGAEFGSKSATGVQMVFQDPVASLNPRRSIGEAVADPLRAAGERDEKVLRDRVRELLERVGLDPDRYDRYPHEFSGGQRQRVGIARALAPSPGLVVCDEPVSALDVTTQAQVIALLGELQRDLGLSLVFVAHDLSVVRQVSDRIAVMHQGRIVEQGTVAEVYGAPTETYTKALLAAVPTLDPVLAAVRRAARRELVPA